MPIDFVMFGLRDQHMWEKKEKKGGEGERKRGARPWPLNDPDFYQIYFRKREEKRRDEWFSKCSDHMMDSTFKR